MFLLPALALPLPISGILRWQLMAPSRANHRRDENSMMKAEDVAKKIADAICSRKQILVMTLQGKMIVLLNKLFPFMLDRIVYNQLAKEPDSPFK